MSIAIFAPAQESPLCNSAAARLHAVKKLCANGTERRLCVLRKLSTRTAFQLHSHLAPFPLWPPTSLSCWALKSRINTDDHCQLKSGYVRKRELIGPASRFVLQTAATCNSPNIIVAVQHVWQELEHHPPPTAQTHCEADRLGANTQGTKHTETALIWRVFFLAFLMFNFKLFQLHHNLQTVNLTM